MRRIIVAIGLFFMLVSALGFSLAPDTLAMSIIGVMFLTITLGFIFGMVPTMQFTGAFQRGRSNIQRIMEVQASSNWVAVCQIENFFQQEGLDRLFNAYIVKVEQQRKNGQVRSDIQEVINEDSLALRSWQSVIVQIPGTLTALGLMGTFIGLIVGISGIGFSSVEAALGSVEILLGGIRTAFYTSIVGVIFSILFNIIYKLLWNIMLRELGLFVEEFHLHVLPSAEEQIRENQHKEMIMILERLDRIPKNMGSLSAMNGSAFGGGNSEQRMMPEIRAGLQAGEFVFYIQPKCNLTTRKIIGGEVLMRWNHSKLGMISPSAFLPVVEHNGFIVRIDRYIWEEVFKTIRKWIDEGKRPVPLAVNISRTDILAMDVAAFFMELVHKYRIPPRNLEIEISETACVESEAEVRELEAQLRQNGFRVLIDDFKGDFVAMSFLQESGADAVKLDLRHMEAQPGREAERVQAIFAQAQKLGYPMAAEGIENAEMLSVLRRCGCTEGQGFYLHRPLSVREFDEMVK